ncbi:hypothetical protein BD410DRAFT_787929 [Rickenella mellea]|uniref:Uncharacterized protein n=1 Tax=Rickenella mellea TaxID=50990 RepID=A0A4Y7Q8D5_9AGAM|nr:hypothetical protein BD410DRAFT_787929 [Rickenella mellea]
MPIKSILPRARRATITLPPKFNLRRLQGRDSEGSVERIVWRPLTLRRIHLRDFRRRRSHPPPM